MLIVPAFSNVEPLSIRREVDVVPVQVAVELDRFRNVRPLRRSMQQFTLPMLNVAPLTTVVVAASLMAPLVQASPFSIVRSAAPPRIPPLRLTVAMSDGW